MLSKFPRVTLGHFPTPLEHLPRLSEHLGGPDEVRFDVVGYCTGGYCVDAAALGLVERGYRVRVLAYATAAIGGAEGLAKSREELSARGVDWIATEEREA